jgi:hypothetical protein
MPTEKIALQFCNVSRATDGLLIGHTIVRHGESVLRRIDLPDTKHAA